MTKTETMVARRPVKEGQVVTDADVAVRGQRTVRPKAPKLCASCRSARLEYEAALQRELYNRRRAAGLCTECGAEAPVGARCSSCAERCRIKSLRSYHRRKPPGTNGRKRCSRCGTLGHNARGCERLSSLAGGNEP